jgi:CheY-like chemotaxis protein
MAKVILLAEDSQDDVTLFLKVMRKSGLNNPVALVRDGEEAIAYLKGAGEFADREKFPMPEILMLDLKMPKMNGFQVLEWIQTQPHLKNLLVVVLSHLGETREINQAYDLGARSYLTKPVTTEDLVNLTSHFGGGCWERTPNPGNCVTEY